MVNEFLDELNENNKEALSVKMGQKLDIFWRIVLKKWDELQPLMVDILQDDPTAIRKGKEIFLEASRQKKEARRKAEKVSDDKIEERWQLCERLVPILGFRKDYIFASLSVLDTKELLNGNEPAIAFAKAFLAKKNKMAPAPNTITPAPMKHSNDDKTPIKSPKEGRVPLEIQVEQMRLMLWTIREIGDLECAKRAFDRAYNSIKEIDCGRDTKTDSDSDSDSSKDT